MDSPFLKLENQLCFPLYVAAKAVVSRYNYFLDEIDLTYTQYIAMMVLWEHNSVSVKELGGYLYLDSGTLTPLLKRLERKGFIQRERSTEDERLVNIAITEAGEALKEKAALVPFKMYDCISLTTEDTQALSTVLTKLIQQMGAGDKV